MKKSYLSKQLVAVIVIVSVLAVAAVLYFAALRPYLARLNAANQRENTEQAPYIQGESLTGSGVKIMTVSDDENKQIYTLGKGEDYHWNLCVERATGAVYIEDYEQLVLNTNTAPYLYFTLRSPSALRILPTAEELTAMRDKKTAGMSKEEIEAAGGKDKVPLSEEDLAGYELPFADYGFSDLSKLNYCTATGKDGVKHTLYIGDTAPDGESVYAMYEGRNALYLISGSTVPFFTMRAEDLVTPIVTYVPQTAVSNYVPDVFAIDRNGQTYVRILRHEAVEAIALDHTTNSVMYKLIYTEEDGTPVYNSYDTSGQYSEMIYNYFRSNIMGQKVVAISPCRQVEQDGETVWSFDPMPDETLAQYGIKKIGAYRAFSYEKDGLMCFLLFSEPMEDEDGAFYYVYNPAFEYIVKMSASSMPFIEEDETYYMSKYVSMFPIDNVERLTVDSTALKEEYLNEAAGIVRMRESFSLYFKMTNDGTQKLVNENGGATITDVKTSNGKSLPNAESGSAVANFQRFYYTLISISMNPNVQSQIDRIMEVDLDTPDVTVTYEIYKGNTHVLKFYFYGTSGSQCFYTYDDGKERYVVSATDVAKALRAAQLVTEGKDVPVDI